MSACWNSRAAEIAPIDVELGMLAPMVAQHLVCLWFVPCCFIAHAELVVMLRKVGLVAVAVALLPFGATVQALAGQLLIVTMITAHLMAQPYASPSLNALELASLAASYMLLFWGVFFFGDASPGGDAATWAGLILCLVRMHAWMTSACAC